MESFDKWLRWISKYLQQPVADVNDHGEDILEELLDNGREDEYAEGGWTYPCKKCGDHSPIICEPHEFNPDYHYCGKNQYCIH